MDTDQIIELMKIDDVSAQEQSFTKDYLHLNNSQIRKSKASKEKFKIGKIHIVNFDSFKWYVWNVKNNKVSIGDVHSRDLFSALKYAKRESFEKHIISIPGMNPSICYTAGEIEMIKQAVGSGEFKIDGNFPEPTTTVKQK